MVTITFWGGINEIGGNCFLVEDKDTRVLLDFGMRYSVYQKYFEEYLKPRTATGMVDALTLGLIPNKLELYRSDLLGMIGKKPPCKPYIDGLLLSHIHYDHSANISYLDERVPIHSSKITELYAKALIESRRRSIETEIYNFKRRPLVNPKDPPINRKFNCFDSEEAFEIGSIRVYPFPVDHSVAGATAYLLECSDASILYTGDIRFHGPLESQTQQSIERIADHKPDILLCEGTRVHEDQSNSEQDVKKQSLDVSCKCRQLIVADFAPTDVFRFLTFHKMAKELGRKLLIMKQDAYLIRKLRKAPLLRNMLPSIDDDSLLVYVDRKDTGTYRSGDYGTWERGFLNLKNSVKSDYVHKHQSSIIACMGFFDINELIDIRPNDGSIYIESISEPHNEEQQIDVERLNNWLDFFQLKKFHFHSSGHANAEDLKAMTQVLNPKRLIPIHTENPALFHSIHDSITRVQLGETIAFPS